MKVDKAVYNYVAPDTARDVKMNAASGRADDLKPSEKLTVVFILTRDNDEEVKAAAEKTLKEFSRDELLKAFEDRLNPFLLKKIVSMYPSDEEVLKMAALQISADGVVKDIVQKAPPLIVDTVSAKVPLPADEIINERKEELSDEDMAKMRDEGAAFPEEFIKEKPDEKKEEYKSVSKTIGGMTVAEKIKLAMLGNKEARGALIKDSNKLVSSTVLKNPRITDDEVIKLAVMRGTSDHLLRQIARNKEWMKTYAIKAALVNNGKTPIEVSIRMLSHLHEKDLVNLSKSKNVSSVLTTAAKRIIDVKKKH